MYGVEMVLAHTLINIFNSSEFLKQRGDIFKLLFLLDEELKTNKQDI